MRKNGSVEMQETWKCRSMEMWKALFSYEGLKPGAGGGRDIEPGAERFLVAMRLRETPVPIPNTMVKA